MPKDYRFTKKEFDSIYSKVPRLTIEIVLKSEKGILLSERNIEPCKGQWHLPGGTVFFGESLQGAVKRVASRELNIEVGAITQIGVIEYPSHYLNGMDAPVGIVFAVNDYSGIPKENPEASKLEWFTTLPKNIHADQDIFLLDHKLLGR